MAPPASQVEHGESRGMVRLVGRMDHGDPAGPRFAWSGCAVQARFSGSSIAVRLRGSADHFNVALDGVALPALALSPVRELYPLATGLSEGAHEIQLVKRTEPLVGEAQLLGFELSEGGRLLLPPPPPDRRIEFVGDSITAGFGVRGRDETCPFSPETEDFSLSYAALAASALGAEPVALAWSGRGVVRNYADEPGDPMPVLYQRTLPARADSRWDFRRCIPQVVVVNLGTNDFSLGGPPPERLFVEGYSTLLRRIRSVYPGAVVFCALGPMLDGAALKEARAYLSSVLDGLRNDGLRGLQMIEFPPQSATEGYGCDGHPSARTHERMAAQLAGAIRGGVGW